MPRLCFGSESITNKVQPETDSLLSCLHIDFGGPLNSSYYLIVVDSFFQVVRHIEMQETNQESCYVVSTRTVCKVRGSRFLCFG